MTKIDWIAAETYDETLRVWAMSGLDMVTEAKGPHDAPLPAFIAERLGVDGLSVVAADGTGTPRAVPCLPLSVQGGAPETGFTIHRLPTLIQTVPSRDRLQDGVARIAGILQAHPDFDGVICLVGARTAWVSISAGEVTDFRTFLTGELLTLLARHSSLAPLLTGEEVDTDLFDAALSQAMSRPEGLAARLSAFAAEDDGARARVAGALIGAELAAAKPWWLGRAVLLVGDGAMPDLYLRALRQAGLTPPVVSGADAGLAGLVAAWRKLNTGEHT